LTTAERLLAHVVGLAGEIGGRLERARMEHVAVANPTSVQRALETLREPRNEAYDRVSRAVVACNLGARRALGTELLDKLAHACSEILERVANSWTVGKSAAKAGGFSSVNNLAQARRAKNDSSSSSGTWCRTVADSVVRVLVAIVYASMNSPPGKRRSERMQRECRRR
jgi:hypothetical protein